MSKVNNKGGGGNVTQKTIHPKGGPAGLGKSSISEDGYFEDISHVSVVPKHIKNTKRITKKYSKDSGSKPKPVNPITPVKPVKPGPGKPIPAPPKKKP